VDNVTVVALLFWPGVVLLCAGLNMLLSWTFSWSELIFDYLVGAISGYFLFAGISPDADAATKFFFVFSHGFFAWIYLISDSFRGAFTDPASFFWTMAAIRLGATLWSTLLDHASVALGAKLDWAPFFFSFLVAPAKFSFALVPSGVGLLIWIAGLANAIFGKGKAGFAGGVLFTEFAPGAGGYHATTIGFTTHAWFGDMPFKHELYHTRQYIYLGDWLIPFWCLGVLWGLASAALAKGHSVSAEVAFGADKNDEVGNPIEVAAHHLA